MIKNTTQHQQLHTTPETTTTAPPVGLAPGGPCPPWCQEVDAVHAATGWDHAAEVGTTVATRQIGYAAVILRRDDDATDPYLTLRVFSVTPADEDGAIELELTVEGGLRLAAQFLKAADLIEQEASR